MMRNLFYKGINPSYLYAVSGTDVFGTTVTLAVFVSEERAKAYIPTRGNEYCRYEIRTIEADLSMS